jgi:hypothetical protein
MSAEKAVIELLKAHGTFVRHGRHEVYRFQGRTITITTTNTDHRGWKNKLAELRRIMRAAEDKKQ